MEELNFTTFNLNLTFINESASLENSFSILEWIVIIGQIMPAICMLLHLIAFLLLPKLRNYFGKHIASLSIALLCCNCTLLAVYATGTTPVSCLILLSANYYFLLSSFTWMSNIAFVMWRSLKEASQESNVTSGKQAKRFVVTCLFAWVLPGVVAIIVVIVDHLQPSVLIHYFETDIGETICIFNHGKIFWIIFIAPITVNLCLNIIFLLLAAINIFTCEISKKDLLVNLCHQMKFKWFTGLILLMCLTHVLDILLLTIHSEIILYAAAVLNIIIGFYFFIVFTWTGNKPDATTH